MVTCRHGNIVDRLFSRQGHDIRLKWNGCFFDVIMRFEKKERTYEPSSRTWKKQKKKTIVTIEQV